MPGTSSLPTLVANSQALSSSWKKKDLPACEEKLKQLKVELTTIAFLPTSEAEKHKKELIVARDVLEIGAHFSLANEDVEGFERYMAQLKTYYHDYDTLLPESAFKYELLGLNLLCLLSKNKIADFHTELEQLPEDTLQNNLYISNPVRLEQFIMEGSYNKVIMMRNNVPAESYTFFINILLVTIREEIASCMERAYETISVAEAGKMLQLDAAETMKLVEKRGWKVIGQKVQFNDPADAKATEEIATDELAKMSITYAREMEQIV